MYKYYLFCLVCFSPCCLIALYVQFFITQPASIDIWYMPTYLHIYNYITSKPILVHPYHYFITQLKLDMKILGTNSVNLCIL